MIGMTTAGTGVSVVDVGVVSVAVAVADSVFSEGVAAVVVVVAVADVDEFKNDDNSDWAVELIVDGVLVVEVAEVAGVELRSKNDFKAETVRDASRIGAGETGGVPVGVEVGVAEGVVRCKSEDNAATVELVVVADVGELSRFGKLGESVPGVPAAGVEFPVPVGVGIGVIAGERIVIVGVSMLKSLGESHFKVHTRMPARYLSSLYEKR